MLSKLKSSLSRYALGDHSLWVRFESQLLESLFNQSFGPFLNDQSEDDCSTKSGHHLEIGYCSVLPTPSADQKLWYSGPLFDEGNCVVHSGGLETLSILEGKAALSTNYVERRSKLSVVAGQEQAVRQALAMNAFVDAADTGGQVVIHAAALMLPSRRELLLIHAPSGTGKTTTSLQLLKAGFALGSDDLAFVMPEQAPWAYGFPRNLKVHRNTAAMLPWVAPRLVAKDWNAEGERVLPLDNLSDFPLIRKPEPMPVAAVIRLARSPGESSLVPIQQTDMLATLVADNVRIGCAGGMSPIDQRRFSALAKLVNRLPLFELRVGADLDSLSAIIQKTL